MACSSADAPDNRPDGGYATASAITISMAMALVASALSTLSIAQLKTARADWGRLQTEYALAEAHRGAVLTLMKDDQPGRLEWTLNVGAETFGAMAEPEAAKVGYADAAHLDNVVLERLGVTDADAFRDRVKAEIAAPASRTPVAELDASPMWRRCAASLLSRYGAATVLSLPKVEAPNARRFSWRAGEVWRVRVTAPDGWSDERLERFTGDPLHPAEVIDRWFTRQGGAKPCDAALVTG